ncbi:MAG: glycosyltransferase [Lachnospiraceae bacterium]|nr:glycosyltransferase [Lachnospiraceae bacterium]
MISVIVPCYNIASYVGRCVHSLLAQTREDLEILLIDDGSTDETGAVCDRLAEEHDRVRAFHQENAGPGIARNTGIEQARGEILAFADGDDAMMPDMLSVLAGALEETGADIAVCPYLHISAEAALQGKIVPEGAGAEPETGKPAMRVLSREEALFALVAEDDDLVIQNAAWNKVYRRRVFEGIRYPAKRYEDIPTSARLLAAADRVCYVARPLYVYTDNRGTSIMNGSERQSILTEQIPAYQARDAFFGETGREELILVHDYIVGKKLLALYTQGRWTAGDRDFARRLRQVINEWLGPRFREIYGCPVANRNHALRMRLFLIHPALYDAFTALNEGVVLPIRRRIGKARAAGREVLS